MYRHWVEKNPTSYVVDYKSVHHCGWPITLLTYSQDHSNCSIHVQASRLFGFTMWITETGGGLGQGWCVNHVRMWGGLCLSGLEAVSASLSTCCLMTQVQKYLDTRRGRRDVGVFHWWGITFSWDVLCMTVTGHPLTILSLLILGPWETYQYSLLI